MLKSVRREPRSMDMTVTAFRDGQVTLRSNRRIDGFTESVKYIGYQGVRQGEVVIHSMDAFAGAIGVSDSDGKMSPVVHIYTAPSDSPEFLVYSLRVASRAGFIRALAKGIRERSTSFDRPVLKTMLLPRPPREDQDAIVEYLDRETQKIDELIAEQRGLIEMLRERRRAVISRMTGWSSSHSEWPQVRLSNVFEKTASGTTPANEDIIYDDTGIPWVNTGELRERELIETRKTVSQSTIERYSALTLHPAGSLLIAMYGATIGRMGILGVPATSNQACCALAGPTRVIPKFAMYSLMAGKEKLVIDASGGGQPNINQQKIRAFRIPLPSLDEQKAIISGIDEQLSRIDELISESEGLIALSQERRAALITAAVTGKIDVRTAT